MRMKHTTLRLCCYDDCGNQYKRTLSCLHPLLLVRSSCSGFKILSSRVKTYHRTFGMGRRRNNLGLDTHVAFVKKKNTGGPSRSLVTTNMKITYNIHRYLCMHKKIRIHVACARTVRRFLRLTVRRFVGRTVSCILCCQRFVRS